MKELKQTHSILPVFPKIGKGFGHITQLLEVYQQFIENINAKSKDEDIEDFIHDQMETLKTLCVSHLSMVQNELVKNAIDWKKKKSED